MVTHFGTRGWIRGSDPTTICFPDSFHLKLLRSLMPVSEFSISLDLFIGSKLSFGWTTAVDRLHL